MPTNYLEYINFTMEEFPLQHYSSKVYLGIQFQNSFINLSKFQRFRANCLGVGKFQSVEGRAPVSH